LSSISHFPSLNSRTSARLKHRDEFF
jgi:hypothetical protein